MRASDSDIDEGEHPSEDEVLAPRVVDSLPGAQPSHARRAGSETTGPLLVGSALGALAIVAAVVLGVLVIGVIWWIG